MGELVSGIRRLLKVTVTKRNLGELLAGAVVFYTCEAVFEFLVLGPASWTRIPNRALFLAFTVVPPFLLCLLTGWLYRWSRKHAYTVWPEVNLVVGPVIFASIYLVVASRVIYQPRPMVLAELVWDAFGFYLMFPLSAFSIMVYTFGITPLVLSVISTTLTGWLIRRRAHSGLVGRLPNPTLPPHASQPPSVGA